MQQNKPTGIETKAAKNAESKTRKKTKENRNSSVAHDVIRGAF